MDITPGGQRDETTRVGDAMTLPNIIDQNGLEVLKRDECMRLIASATLGRLGVTMKALPVILPINFSLIGERILFRTAVGTKLNAATDHAVVSFEVDDFDAFSHTGWSVLVTGITREITAADEVAALRSAPIPRWAPRGDDRIVEIEIKKISGRRISYTDDRLGEWYEVAD